MIIVLVLLLGCPRQERPPSSEKTLVGSVDGANIYRVRVDPATVCYVRDLSPELSCVLDSVSK